MELAGIPPPAISPTLIALHTKLGTAPADLSDLISKSIKSVIDGLETHAKREVDTLVTAVNAYKEEFTTLNGLLGESKDPVDVSPHAHLRHAAHQWEDQVAKVKTAYKQRYEMTKSLYQQIDTFRPMFGNRMPLSKAAIPAMAPSGQQLVTMDLISKLETEICKCTEEKTKRSRQCAVNISQIIEIWDELDITPTSNFDQTITNANTPNSQEMINILPVTDENLSRLESRLHELSKEKEDRRHRISSMYEEIRDLWQRLDTPSAEQEAFVNRWKGCSAGTIKAYEDELNRMQELKRENMSIFIADARERLKNAWDQIFMTEEERQMSFPNAYISIDGAQAQLLDMDTILAHHEAEIQRLVNIFTNSAKLFEVVAKYDELIAEMEEFQAAANDGSRLLSKTGRDPGRLLREEKFRKRVERERPRFEKELEVIIPKWEQEHGQPFTVWGSNYLEIIRERLALENEDKENRKRAKAMGIDLKNNPAPARAGPANKSLRPITPPVPSTQPKKAPATGHRSRPITPGGIQKRVASTEPRIKYRSTSQQRAPLSQLPQPHPTPSLAARGRAPSSSLFTPQTSQEHSTVALVGPSPDLPQSSLYMATMGMGLPRGRVSKTGLSSQMGIPLTLEELDRLELEMQIHRDMPTEPETPCRRDSADTVISSLALGSPAVQRH